MRKFTILSLALCLVSTITFAQLNEMRRSNEIPKAKIEKKADNSTAVKSTVEPAWAVDFDEVTPSWTFGNTMGNVDFEVGNDASRPCYWGPVNPDGTGWYVWSMDEVYEAYELGTPGSYAFIDIMGHRSLPLSTLPTGCSWTGTGIEPYNAFMTFENLDFSDVEIPYLTFVHSGRVSNVSFFDFVVEYSLNDGTSWTTFSVVDAEDLDASNFFDGPVELGIPGLAGQANVDLRFRHQSNDFTADDFENYGISMAWLIDDVMLFDYADFGADYDLSVYDTRINFFDYYDYTDPEYEGIYHASSYYGQIPQDQFPAGVLLFNVSVENKGTQTVAPSTRIKVSNPDGTEIYNEVVVGPSIAFTVKDTVDIVDNVCTINDPIVGKYMVYFEAFIDGQVDENLADNYDTAYFYISPTTFSREAFDINDNVSPKEWADGGENNDGVATTYTITYEGDDVHSVDVFIDEASSIGAEFYVEVIGYDGTAQTWSNTHLTAYPITIEESMLGAWVNVTFPDTYTVEIEDPYTAVELMVAVRMNYNGEDNDILIGESNVNTHSLYGTYWFLAGEATPKWRLIGNYYGGAPAIRLNIGAHVPYDPTVVYTNKIDGIQIYPNPTYGTLNIENVEGAQVKIINMMGQVVENIENAQMTNTVDMSKYANGTYFVKVINGSATSTHKVNLMK